MPPAESWLKTFAVRVDVDGDVETFERSRLESGMVYDVEYAAGAAEGWFDGNCASSDGKRFGPCEADDGIVQQEREGGAVLLAVAFDVDVVGPGGEVHSTLVVEVGR